MKNFLHRIQFYYSFVYRFDEVRKVSLNTLAIFSFRPLKFQRQSSQKDTNSTLCLISK